MTIENLIIHAFPEGLKYDEAAQLCLLLYCEKILSNDLTKQCKKDNLSEIFARLSASEKVHLDIGHYAVSYGANYHDQMDKGHWVEVIASVFKIGNVDNLDKQRPLKKALPQNQWVK